MYYLSNTFFGKILTTAVRFFYLIDYKDTFFLREASLKALGSFRYFYKTLTYGNGDMFDEISVEATTYCNRRCPYCPNSIFSRGAKDNERLMPVRLFKKIVDELKEIQYRGVFYPHLYGEPLLDARLPELMDYASKNLPKARIVIVTNGDFLNIDMIDKLYEAGVRSYLITIHDDIFKNEIRIKNVMKHIRKANKKIKIICQIMNDNTALSTRVGLVNIKNVKKNDFQCTSPLCIDYKGDILICCHDYLGKSAVFGNVEKEKLMELWRKKEFRNIRIQLSKKKYVLDICKKCADLNRSKLPYNESNKPV